MDLFEGENIGLKEDSPQQLNLSDEEINKKYRDGEIRIVTEQARYPLNIISSMVHSKNYKLNPEYQRRHRWNNEKRSKLIESLIMNVPLPPIFLYEYEREDSKKIEKIGSGLSFCPINNGLAIYRQNARPDPAL
ncbi:hypothetical protein MNBD_GAMMA18-96 [hydrothermal vent metagenome]|uniref:GmrSD restriction endonucleases N-terminal domain-containing protein n=1 Tax=hydrothermal vent metagenome TaxID=652676 RepID=A0A3B0ZBG0_9ZZZZ